MSRRSTYLFLAINLSVLAYLLYAFSTLISLLFESASFTDAIRPAELLSSDGSPLHTPAVSTPPINGSLPSAALPSAALSSAVAAAPDGPFLIPKIIHQTYINSSIPPRWQSSQKSCIDLHPDYTYMLWTDDGSRNFIKQHYPWFLETFDQYPFPIQRADTIRYFILAHYGGIYLDLDDGCQRRLDPLLQFPAWLRRTLPTGISNDAMGAVPNHPFFLRVIESLEHYNHNWLMPYVTVMYSTGPLFLSVVWKQYVAAVQLTAARVRVLMPPEYSNHDDSFFRITKGDSWHEGDARTIFWMGQHWLLLTVLGAAAVIALMFSLWWVWNSSVTRGRTPAGDWSPVWRRASMASPIEKRRYQRGLWGRLAFWRSDHDYDLVDRTA